jgi:hypothetical protein
MRADRAFVHRSLLPLSAAAIAALTAAAIYWLGPPGVDTPAHLFQTWLYEHQGFVWWNNDWYSGRYVYVAYSVLFYPLAATIGLGALSVIAAAVLTSSAAWVMLDRYGFKAALAPALLLAFVAPYNMMVSGAYPFLCGAAAMAVAIVCVQRGWRIGFAVAALVTFGFSPLALALLAVVMAGVLFGDGITSMVKRHRLELGAFVFVLALAAAVQHVFSAGTSYPYGWVDLLVIGTFCVAGFLLAGSGSNARSLRAMFAVYLAVNAAAFLVAAPVGSNAGRLFAEAGAPLILLTRNVAGRRSPLILILAGVALVAQMAPFVRDMSTAWSNPGSTRNFWQPSVDYLQDHPSGHQYRVEVVANWGHWEALYLPEAGFYIARGWYRQDDQPQNGVFYASRLTAARYDHWLRSVGVRYVVLPRGPHDQSARAEARLLLSGRSGLQLVADVGNAKIYELPFATPIVTAPPGQRVKLRSLASGSVAMSVSAAGTYLLRVRYTPYWSTAKGITARESKSGMTLVTTHDAGPVRLHIDPPLS